VVSIDALHPAALGPESSPVIHGLMREGASTLDGRSTDPPLTLISHTAMFTGLGPAENGKTDNQWVPGMPTVAMPTLFNTAKKHGFFTVYVYSKEKLGYLVNHAVDEHRLSKDFAVEEAEHLMKKPGRHFVFLHISGLDEAGPLFGWLSPPYMEELLNIDETLRSLIETVSRAGNYLMIITSDHAGHATIHGSDHPDDSKLPMVIASDRFDLGRFQNMRYSVLDLKPILEKLFLE
jgi:predicted AlkP superfamily pyrophosphatase or phosphodiesterase